MPLTFKQQRAWNDGLWQTLNGNISNGSRKRRRGSDDASVSAVEAVRACLKAGADAFTDQQTKTSRPFIVMAAKYGHWDKVVACLDCPPRGVDIGAVLGEVLRHAVGVRAIEASELRFYLIGRLLDLGASPYIETEYDISAFEQAVFLGCWELVTFFLDHPVKVAEEVLADIFNNALWCCVNRHMSPEAIEVVQKLLDLGASPYIKTEYGASAFEQAVLLGYWELVAIFLNYSVRVTEKVLAIFNNVLWSFVHYSGSPGATEIVQRLLYLGASPYIKTEYDTSAFEQAVLLGRWELVAVFLNHPPKVTEEVLGLFNKALYFCVTQNMSLEVITILQRLLYLDASPYIKTKYIVVSAFERAVQVGCWEVVDIFLNHPAKETKEVLVTNFNNALWHCVDLDMPPEAVTPVQRLLYLGASPYIKTGYGESAFEKAMGLWPARDTGSHWWELLGSFLASLNGVEVTKPIRGMLGEALLHSLVASTPEGGAMAMRLINAGADVNQVVVVKWHIVDRTSLNLVVRNRNQDRAISLRLPGASLIRDGRPITYFDDGGIHKLLKTEAAYRNNLPAMKTLMLCHKHLGNPRNNRPSKTSYSISRLPPHLLQSKVLSFLGACGHRDLAVRLAERAAPAELCA